MKRIICLLAATSIVVATGCSAVGSGDTAKTGTFEGKGTGYGGELVLQVETEGEKIKDIKLVSDHESSPVIKRAFPVIKDRIIEAQTPVVDSVSGATFSSFAVKKAVAEAMKEAGKDFGEITMNTKGAEVDKKQLEEVKTQLVIVGGGPAGLTAAIEAKESGVEDVILVEKLDILSGNGKFDMNFFDMINTEAQKANGVEDSVEKFIEDKKETAWDTPERLRAQAEGAAELDQWLRGMGINLNYNYGGRNHMAEADAYAGEHENGSLGKTECWYVLDCEPGTEIVIGHNAKDKAEVEKMIRNHEWSDFIRKVPVHKGDFFQINPGCVHAIKGGTLILETQQSSDITYRVYDYDRLQNGKPRQLHVEQSIDVIEAPFKTADIDTFTEEIPGAVHTHFVTCKFYSVDKYDFMP